MVTADTTAAPRVLTQPTPRDLAGSRAAEYMRWLADERGLRFADWDELHAWSVTEIEAFWQSIWDFFGIQSHAPYSEVLPERVMPGARWFPGATLNFAEHVLRNGAADDDVALVAVSQARDDETVTFGDLRDRVARARAGLSALGVGKGDRVAAYLPNIPETVVAYLATVSLGAIWASVAPEFGAAGTVDRIGQIDPKVLLVVDGYTYGRKQIDRRDEVARIVAGLPSVARVVHVPWRAERLDGSVSWDELLDRPGAELAFEPVPFDHPLSVLFTSGTTGRPKPIVHGHGGILLEHIKNHALHWDMRPGDRLLWFSTTAWMVWNSCVSVLLLGASLVLIDGDPNFPDLRAQWRLAERVRPSLMGASAGLIMMCREQGIEPAREFDLSSIRQIGSVGSPLPPEGHEWIREQFGPDVLINVGSGGTDICSGIVQATPLKPTWSGEMTGPALGVDAKAFDADGREVIGELGELVIAQPIPSMPVFFWGDDDGSRLREAYFDMYPGIWRHGDWAQFSDRGTCIITGRSDATLNRGGVRLGTAEFSALVERFPEVADSVVVHLEDPAGGLGALRLFVVIAEGHALDDGLRDRIRSAIRSELSPRHVPDEIAEVPALPHTRTGKKLEVPIKRILQGGSMHDVANPESVDDPAALAQFERLR